jgi:hypothetical protein
MRIWNVVIFVKPDRASYLKFFGPLTTLFIG